MRRRAFVVTAGLACGISAGCLGGNGADPDAEIGYVDLENHRRDGGYEFSLRIDDGSATVFEETARLGPAGAGEDAVAFEDPVADPGSYTVRVEAAGHAAAVTTADLISAEQTCLGFAFSLGQRTLHAEHRSYNRCD